MEGIGGRAIEFLADQTEVLGAARFEHANDHAVLAAHAPHDLAHRVELAKLASDVALDILEFQLLGRRIKGQRPVGVVDAVNGGQFLAFVLEKLAADRVVPLHRIQHANRRLRVDQTVGQRAHDQLITVQPGMTVHAFLTTTC